MTQVVLNNNCSLFHALAAPEVSAFITRDTFHSRLKLHICSLFPLNVSLETR